MFYRNKINGNCTWVQPEDWKKDDERLILEARQRRERGYTDTENNAALTLQSIYRGKIMREDFASLLKAVRIMRNCETKYLRDPNNLRALCNYTLYVLTIQQDYGRTRPLITEAMKRMIKIGPDVPFILYDNITMLLSLSCLLINTHTHIFSLFLSLFLSLSLSLTHTHTQVHIRNLSLGEWRGRLGIHSRSCSTRSQSRSETKVLQTCSKRFLSNGNLVEKGQGSCDRTFSLRSVPSN